MEFPSFSRMGGRISLGTTAEARRFFAASQGKPKPPSMDTDRAMMDARRRVKEKGGKVTNKLAVLAMTQLQFGK